MKNLLSFLLLFACAITARSQNLVPNPNFSIHDSCPDNWSQITKCKYWYSPHMGSPDYFNACHDTLSGSPGVVGVSMQASPDGAYIGLYTFLEGSAGYREYAGTNIPALIPGAVYRVLMKVSLNNYSYFATNAPDVFFYNSLNFGIASIYNIPRTPQVDFSLAGNITDKINWVTLIDTFTTDSAYTHLVVGNFKDDASTSKTPVPDTGVTVHHSYYIIDSISVEKIGNPNYIHTDVSGQSKASIYPNPFADNAVLNIENLSGSNNTLSIMNAQGALVRKVENISSGQTTILRDGLEPGFYYYQLRSQDGNVLSGKMVIQ